MQRDFYSGRQLREVIINLIKGNFVSINALLEREEELDAFEKQRHKKK